MSTTDIGRVGEAKVIARLSELGYYPFIDISGKCPVDIVAWKDGRTYTFQVKATNSKQKGGSKSWAVQIGCIRPNRSGNIIHKFNSESCDYLAIYIQEIDTVCFLPSDGLPGRVLSISLNGKTKVEDYTVI